MMNDEIRNKLVHVDTSQCLKIFRSFNFRKNVCRFFFFLGGGRGLLLLLFLFCFVLFVLFFLLLFF